jgi:hypothetical protein
MSGNLPGWPARRPASRHAGLQETRSCRLTPRRPADARRCARSPTYRLGVWIPRCAGWCARPVLLSAAPSRVCPDHAASRSHPGLLAQPRPAQRIPAACRAHALRSGRSHCRGVAAASRCRRGRVSRPGALASRGQRAGVLAAGPGNCSAVGRDFCQNARAAGGPAFRPELSPADLAFYMRTCPRILPCHSPPAGDSQDTILTDTSLFAPPSKWPASWPRPAPTCVP